MMLVAAKRGFDTVIASHQQRVLIEPWFILRAHAPRIRVPTFSKAPSATEPCQATWSTPPSSWGLAGVTSHYFR
jgi:hypothetical protein